MRHFSLTDDVFFEKIVSIEQEGEVLLYEKGGDNK